jgi:hypothetical protein
MELDSVLEGAGVVSQRRVINGQKLIDDNVGRHRFGRGRSGHHGHHGNNEYEREPYISGPAQKNHRVFVGRFRIESR